MKDKSIIPSSREKVMRENDFIVSKTDLTGRITYGNRIFIEFQVIAKRNCWGLSTTLSVTPTCARRLCPGLEPDQGEKEFFGFVKNMAKDGSFYWVFTHITPSYDERGKMVGYLSCGANPMPAFFQPWTVSTSRCWRSKNGPGRRRRLRPQPNSCWIF